MLRELAPTCFLFRDRSALNSNWRSRPVTDGIVNNAWDQLLMHYEKVLEKRGERMKDGGKVRFIKKYADGKPSQLYFPLHSLRVSLLTALALDGGASISVLMKLAGPFNTSA